MIAISKSFSAQFSQVILTEVICGRAITIACFVGDTPALVLASVHLLPAWSTNMKLDTLRKVRNIAAMDDLPLICCGDFNFLHSDERRMSTDNHEIADNSDAIGKRFENLFRDWFELYQPRFTHHD